MLSRYGTGATSRPSSTSTLHCSSRSSPPPPMDSGSAAASTPACANAAYRSRSKCDGCRSSAFSRSCVIWSVTIWRVSAASSCCVSLRVKSIVASSASARGQPQPGHGDDVALHLVRAAAEGQDQRRAVHALHASVQQGGGGVHAHRAVRAEHLHEQPVGLRRELGAEHLVGGGGSRAEVLGRRHPPVHELEHLGARIHAREVGLHPLLVD